MNDQEKIELLQSEKQELMLELHEAYHKVSNVNKRNRELEAEIQSLKGSVIEHQRDHIKKLMDTIETLEAQLRDR